MPDRRRQDTSSSVLFDAAGQPTWDREGQGHAQHGGGGPGLERFNPDYQARQQARQAQQQARQRANTLPLFGGQPGGYGAQYNTGPSGVVATVGGAPGAVQNLWNASQMFGPSYQSMLQGMGVNPTINAQSVWNMPDRGVAGATLSNPGFGRGIPDVMRAAPQQGVAAPQRPGAPSGAGVGLPGYIPGGVGQAGGQSVGGGYAPRPFGGGGLAPGGATQGSMASRFGAMNTQGPTVSSGFNPMDPFAVSRAQEADRQAALDLMSNYVGGTVGSPLGAGIESLATQLAQNPESIDDATQRALEGQAIEQNRLSTQELQREAAEDLARRGIRGVYAGDTSRRISEGGARGLDRQLQDLRVQRALRRGEDRRSAIGASSQALDLIGRGLLGPAMERQTQILMPERDDQQLVDAMFRMFFGLGGGV